MAGKLSAEDVERVRRWAKECGRRAAEQAYGPLGPALDTKFADMEDVAVQACDAFNAGLLEHGLQQHAALFQPPQPCPHCGRLCDVLEESRPLATRRGAIESREPLAHCPTCRRDFFPSASGAGAQ